MPPASTTSAWRRVAALVTGCALAASGCTVNRARAGVLSTTRGAEWCGEVTMRGELAAASATEASIGLEGELICGAPTRTVYRVEGWTKLNTGGLWAVALGSGLAGGLGVAGIAAAAAGARNESSDGLEVLALGSVFGFMGLGYLLASVLRMALPDEKETEETPGPPMVRRFTVAGPLESPYLGRRWPLEDGGVTLALATVPDLDLALEAAQANGFPVQWSTASLANLTTLATCRRALEGWSPAAPPDCRRFDAALRCSEGGWTVAEPVKSALQFPCTDPAHAPDAGLPAAPPPAAAR